MQNDDMRHAFSYTVRVKRKLHVVNLLTQVLWRWRGSTSQLEGQ